MIDVSVVLPTFNEELAVKKVVSDIYSNTKSFTIEIIVVDSGTDNTASIASALGARVFYRPPTGHGDALRYGLLQAQGEIIISADCDDTYPMAAIAYLVAEMKNNNIDVISACRLTTEKKQAMPLLNRLGNIFLALSVRVLFGIAVHDVTTGMFAIRKNSLVRLNLLENLALPCEIILRTQACKLNYKEVFISYAARLGVSKLQAIKSLVAYVAYILKTRSRYMSKIK